MPGARPAGFFGVLGFFGLFLPGAGPAGSFGVLGFFGLDIWAPRVPQMSAVVFFPAAIGAQTCEGNKQLTLTERLIANSNPKI